MGTSDSLGGCSMESMIQMMCVDLSSCAMSENCSGISDLYRIVTGWFRTRVMRKNHEVVAYRACLRHRLTCLAMF